LFTNVFLEETIYFVCRYPDELGLPESILRNIPKHCTKIM
jgi:hypothetical protein